MGQSISFAVQGVTRIETRLGGGRTDTPTVFEVRVVHIPARTERAARRSAHQQFSRDAWVAVWPAPDVARQTQKYMGISRSLELGGELEKGEV